MAKRKSLKQTGMPRVGAAQLPGLPLARAAESLALIEKAVADAASRGIELLVLPECAYPAYHLGGAEAYHAATELKSEAFVARLRQAAGRSKINLVCGFVEEAAGVLHNAAVVIDAKGEECGRHRKCFLWGDDNVWFESGQSLTPIDTPVGKIGVIICADGRAPEMAAGLVAQGAELIAVPTCWVNVATKPGEYRNAQAEFMLCGRAIECGVPFVAANKFGMETDQLGYCGWSVIYDAQGKQLAQAPPDEATIIDAAVRPAAAKPLEVPYWAVRRIFSTYAPVLPNLEEIDKVKIAVAPTELLRGLRDAGATVDLFEELAAQGVSVVGTSLSSEDEADSLEVYGRSLGMAVVGFPFVERLMMEEFGKFGCVAGEHMTSFVAARLMALDGASIVFVAGDEVPMPLLRTRAVENRVFVAAATSTTAALIDPAGVVIDQVEASAGQAIVREIDLRVTANKQVFQGTDIWEQRHPSVYAKAFGVDPKFTPLS
jgi:predicted amidohydrolase